MNQPPGRRAGGPGEEGGGLQDLGAEGMPLLDHRAAILEVDPLREEPVHGDEAVGRGAGLTG